MSRYLDLAARFYVNEDAATIVEYTFLIMFVALGCFAAVASLGSSLKNPFQNASNGLS